MYMYTLSHCGYDSIPTVIIPKIYIFKQIKGFIQFQRLFEKHTEKSQPLKLNSRLLFTPLHIYGQIVIDKMLVVLVRLEEYKFLPQCAVFHPMPLCSR